MKGKKQVIEGVYPVTVASAVYMDNTSKTLKDMIDNKELGSTTTISTSGRGECMFVLRSAKININKVIVNGINNGTISYSFPTDDSDRVRRMFVYAPNGSIKTLDIPNGELETHCALVYDWTTNTLKTVKTQWGSMTCTNNEYVLLFNSLGNVSGILSHHCYYGSDNTSFPIKSIQAENIASRGSTQGIIIIDGNIYTCYHATDDHSLFDGTIGSKKHNICHMNAPYYNHKKDVLIIGNGSKSYVLELKGWIFKNWKNTYNNSEQLDVNALDKVELDFTQFEGESKAQLCWGYDDTDIIYLATNDNRIIRKLELLKDANGEYTGQYNILKTYRSRISDIVGGMFFHEGCVYFGVKGEYGIRKCILKHDGYFDSEYIQIEGKQGDMQGICVYNDEVYAYTDSKGYKFSVDKLK